MKRYYSLKMKPVTLVGLVVISSLVLTACSGLASASSPSATQQVTGSNTVQVANNSNLGQILVTTDGMTLHSFEIDTPKTSNCSDLCARYWPPYTASAQPTAGPEITGELGTITRSDGALQVTYDCKPLYTYFGDKNPGDVNGDGLNEWGGIWHVVSLGNTSSESSSSGIGGGSGY
jgi:predicted lipoprotein with Yx(FWY)xxD motif